MRFLRSRTATTGQRAGRTQKAPPEVLQKIAADPCKMNYYFDLWVGHKENWAAVAAYEQTWRRETDDDK
eukprot:10185166-Alexandrium_andersonii.AAC.1